MNNPLLENFGFVTQLWFSQYAIVNLIAAACCAGFIIYSYIYYPARFARPSFIISILALILYQIPLVLFSPLFHKYLPNSGWFAVSINFAVIANLLWVSVTPFLNIQTSFYKPVSTTDHDFGGFALWFPIMLLLLLLFAYFYRIPFHCTALYSLFTDQDIALLMREITGKLMGRTYAPHVLNIITGAIGPIVAFFSAGRIYICCKDKRWLSLPLWGSLILITIMVPLLGGAKGALVPMGVAMAITGLLVIRNWKWRILAVCLIMIILLIMIMIVKMAQEVKIEKDNYQFGTCIAELGVCDSTRVLLQSLELQKSYYGMSKKKIYYLEEEVGRACKIEVKRKQNMIAGNKNTDSPNSSKISIYNHIKDIFYRIFANPLQVAAWHFLYVVEYGRPGLGGLPIAKLFSDNYVSIPTKVCEVYYSGDKTSVCTAPTGYLFTYPAYLGIAGLLLAFLATVIFDIAGALVIKYSTGHFSSLAIGLMAVAGINFMVSDYTTVIISHGAGAAIWLLAILMCKARDLI